MACWVTLAAGGCGERRLAEGSFGAAPANRNRLRHLKMAPYAPRRNRRARHRTRVAGIPSASYRSAVDLGHVRTFPSFGQARP